jgi:uncharacterized protein YndB with AHSA1/START domain
MRILKIVLSSLVGLLLILTLVGFFLPEKIEIARGITIDAPPEKVFAILENPKRWKEWSAWNKRDPSMIMEFSGAEKGVGAKWAWKSKSEGDGSMEYVVSEPAAKLVYDLRFGANTQPSKGEFILNKYMAQTKVVWTMYADSGANPIYRWMSLLAEHFVGPDFEAGLNNLKALTEKEK